MTHVVEYGYANTRVKAMKARLIDAETMQKLQKAKDAEEMISILYNTDYKQNLIEFGGTSAKAELIDFAISKNIAEKMEKLVRLTPERHKAIMRMLAAKWDFANIKLAIEAKERQLSYESIAAYVIDRGPFKAEIIKEAMEKKDISDLLGFFASKATHTLRPVIDDARAAYEKTRNAIDAINALDYGLLMLLATSSMKLFAEDQKAMRILRTSVDMQNAITLIRSKLVGLSFEAIEKNIVPYGMLTIETMKEAYAKAKNVEELAEGLGIEGLAEGIANWKKTGILAQAEIGMNNALLRKSVALASTVLSFATLVGYAYAKELEALRIRIMLKGKQYGLSEEELGMLLPERA